MKYRSRTEITSEILKVARTGTPKTKIMYKAYLSFTQLKEYLAVLILNDLLTYDKPGQSYKTTEKGMRFLAMYEKMTVLTGDMMTSNSSKVVSKPAKV